MCLQATKSISFQITFCDDDQKSYKKFFLLTTGSLFYVRKHKRQEGRYSWGQVFVSSGSNYPNALQRNNFLFLMDFIQSLFFKFFRNCFSLKLSYRCLFKNKPRQGYYPKFCFCLKIMIKLRNFIQTGTCERLFWISHDAISFIQMVVIVFGSKRIVTISFSRMLFNLF